MADIVYKLMSWLYAIVAVTILSLWSILMVVSLSADALRRPKTWPNKWEVITLIAAPSLLTFLVCKIVVAVFQERRRSGSDKSSKTSDRSPKPRRHNTGNMIRWIATAADGSPQGSLVLLLLSGTWLLEVLRVMMSLMVLTGIVMIWTTQFAVQDLPHEDSALNATVAASNENIQQLNSNLLDAKQNITSSLNEFKTSSGIDLVSFLNNRSAKGLMTMVIGLWGLLIGLLGYVIAQAVSAFKTVLTSPKEAWVGRKDEAESLMDRKTAEVASEVI